MRLVQNRNNKIVTKFKKKLRDKLKFIVKNIKFRTRIQNEIIYAKI